MSTIQNPDGSASINFGGNGVVNTNGIPIGQYGNRYVPVNQYSIAAMLTNATAVNSKAAEAQGNAEAMDTVEVTKQYPWKSEVISSSLWWDTAYISHIIKYVADQIFDDVESAFVYYDPQVGVTGCLFFTYGGKPKSENGIVAFSTFATTPAATIAEQAMQMAARQKNGDIIVSKQGQNILGANFIFLPNNVMPGRNPNWIKGIDWTKYVDVVKSASPTGASIRLSGLNIQSIISLIIKEDIEEAEDENGKPIEIKSKLDVSISPGPMIPGSSTMEQMFIIDVANREKATKVINRIYGNARRYNSGNPYISYV